MKAFIQAPSLLKVFSLILIGSFVAGASSCDGDKVDEEADDPRRADVVELQSVYQNVRYLNCKNELIKEEVERVEAPTKYMRITPTSNFVEEIFTSKFTNTRTGSKPGYIADKVNFHVTYDEGQWEYMHVRAGINEIRYEFEFKNGRQETGLRYIDVRYSYSVRKESLERRPPAGECK